jgi:hypothetical protein
MVLPLKHPRAWLVIGWVMVAFVILVSLLPGGKLPVTGVNDKVEHLLFYTLLAVWFAGIYPRSRYVVIGLGLFLMGAAIEWAQGAMNLGRQSDFRDLIANSVGISIGLCLALVWLGGWAQRLEARAPKW